MAVSADETRTYHRWQLWLGLGHLLLTGAYLVTLIASGASVALRDALDAFAPRWWLALPLMLIVLGGGEVLLALPIRWLGGFWLPRRFGLSHQGLGSWLWDGFKAALIGGGLAVAAALPIWALLRTTSSWWLWGAGIVFAGYALIALVAPIWLVPLFYRLSPLGEGELRSRLLRLAERAGVPAIGVWIADQSRKSRTANAALAGLGRTRRILLFDTLVSEFRPEEIEAVLAHELGHHVHGDMWRGLVVQGTLTLVTFWILDHALGAASTALPLKGPADLAALPLWGLLTMCVTLTALPVMNGWSRHVEQRADDFALALTEDPESFVEAMERLAVLNLAERDPHFLKRWLLYSHPPIAQRVSRARQWTPRSAG